MKHVEAYVYEYPDSDMPVELSLSMVAANELLALLRKTPKGKRDKHVTELTKQLRKVLQ